MPRLFTSAGSEVVLGSLLGKGGEGSVFAVTGSSSTAAKVYSKPLSPAKQHKLADMVKGCSADLTKISCWPLETLYSSRRGEVVGFLMPRLENHQPIYKLYSPAHRRADFPNADWSFLIHAARNLAAALETIHDAGHVVGDLNQGNVFVSKEATVKLIDCDSIQVQLNGSLYLCEVGVAHFTPPELQNKSFHGVHRTQDHDNFGLAVLCFHLLFMGRHPFAGRYLGTGDMPIEKAILEERFVYGAKAASKQMVAPPNTFPLKYASEAVANLFELALDRSTGSLQRPTARLWKESLDTLERNLITCRSFPVHKYPRSLTGCFWCDLEKQAHIYFYILPFDTRWQTGIFDVNAIWRRIERILAPPSISTSLQKGHPKGQPAAFDLRLKSIFRLSAKLAIGLAGVVILFGFRSPWGVALIVVAFSVWKEDPLEQEKQRRTDAKNKVIQEWEAIYRQCEAENSDRRFLNRKTELEQTKREYEGLNGAYRTALQQLEKDRFNGQLSTFLKSYFIDSATIKGFGTGLKSILSSYGIETAADVTYQALSKVPGIGSKRAGDLIAWRKAIERQFLFNPTQGVSQAEVSNLRQEYDRKRKRLEKLLIDGVSDLKQVSDSITAKRKVIQAKVEDCAVRHAQAFADVEAVTYPWALTLFLILLLGMFPVLVSFLVKSSNNTVMSTTKKTNDTAIEQPIVKESAPASIKNDTPAIVQPEIDEFVPNSAGPPFQLLNGDDIIKPYGEEGDGRLKLVNHTTLDAVAKLVQEKESPRLLRYWFIEAGKSVEISGLGKCVCLLYLSQGRGWDDDLKLFTSDKSYYMYLTPIIFDGSTTDNAQKHVYQIALSKKQIDERMIPVKEDTFNDLY